MSTYTIDTATSRATPTPAPMKRLTAPAIQARKGGEPIVCLTAYTMRMAQLLDPHCDLLLVGDSLGQVIYGLPSTVPVTMEMMCAHGAAGVICGSAIVDLVARRELQGLAEFVAAMKGATRLRAAAA